MVEVRKHPPGHAAGPYPGGVTTPHHRCDFLVYRAPIRSIKAPKSATAW